MALTETRGNKVEQVEKQVLESQGSHPPGGFRRPAGQ